MLDKEHHPSLSPRPNDRLVGQASPSRGGKISPVVFISGGSRGIGAATARCFAREGYGIVLTYKTHKDEALAATEECQRLGARETLILNLDLTNDESIRRAADLTKQKFGQIGMLVNNAGIYEEGLAHEQDFEQIRRQITTNLEGPIKLTRELLPVVTTAVVNVASRLGTVGKKKASVYAATKWGLRGFTKSLALERPDLRVLAVNPGLTATQMGAPEGMPPEKVAEIIFNAAVGKYNLKSGSDVNVKYYVLGKYGRLVYLLKFLVKQIMRY